MTTLETSWHRCFDDLGGSRPPPSVWEELLARYSEPHRAYHTVQHLEECFGWFDQVRHLANRRGDVAFALFYHDVIYDTHATNNEEESAKLAVTILDEYVRGDVEPNRVVELIISTRHDGIVRSNDAKLLVDIDLSILGATRIRFDEYEQQIRREYQWVPEKSFRDRRRRILTGFLERPMIYNTDFFRVRLEGKARTNLQRSLSALG